jgi:hypothetical protein
MAVARSESRAVIQLLEAFGRPSRDFVMPGLVPGIHVLLDWHMAGGWVYIMTSRREGTLYVGVTAVLPKLLAVIPAPAGARNP